MTGLDEKKLYTELSRTIYDAPLNLLYLESCESTNIECRQLAQHNSIVIAESQTAGRGRRGKTWHSPFSKNIYCSIGLVKNIKSSYLGLISLQVGVSIVTVLRQQGFKDSALKWPNDILLQGKKLGGILIETKIIEPDLFYLVIGFGLNVTLDELDLQEIDQPATGLNQVSDRVPDRQQLIIDLVSQISQEVMAFDLHQTDSLIKRFNDFDLLRGKQVLVKTDIQEISGNYLGILETGQIQIDTGSDIQSFSAAEISLRGL